MRKTFVLLVAALTSALANAETIELTVNGLVCGFCAQGIEKTLKKNPATVDVFVSLEEKLVAVSIAEGQDIPDAELKQALTDSGYEVKSIQRTETPIADIRARIEKDSK